MLPRAAQVSAALYPPTALMDAIGNADLPIILSVCKNATAVSATCYVLCFSLHV